MIPSSRVINRTEEILLGQRFVPLSPAALDEAGSVCLCAAASLAAAGLESKFGMDTAAEFRVKANSMSSLEVEEVFELLGWPRALCADMRACNDAATPNDRLSVVRLKLKQLTSPTQA